MTKEKLVWRSETALLLVLGGLIGGLIFGAQVCVHRPSADSTGSVPAIAFFASLGGVAVGVLLLVAQLLRKLRGSEK